MTPERPFLVGTRVQTPFGMHKVSSRADARGIDTVIKPSLRSR